MRVAILTPYSSEMKRGGVEIANAYLETIFEEVDYFYYENESKFKECTKLYTIFKEEIMSYHVGRKFIKASKKEKYDLIISNGMYGWMVKLANLSIPRINIYHGNYIGYHKSTNLEWNLKSKVVSKIHKFFEKLSSSKNKNITVSKFNQKQLKRYYKINSEVIHLGIDASKFQYVEQQKARTLLGLPENKKIFLFVGRLERSKGIDIIKKVVEKYPEFIFAFVGEGERLIENSNAVYFSSQDYRKMNIFYSAVNGVLIPSLFESASLVALESMMCGTPILMNKTGYAEEIAEVYPNFVTDIENYIKSFERFIITCDKSSKDRLITWVKSKYSIPYFYHRWDTFVKRILEEL
ncbi:glycosyltransferase family 4 protein [Bacillus sp. EB106-08-02-XG196]|uniref:glycosyltransferase family 4 protein n=1 Tax=Bacillus sp. EB106-08-02-XG196 TaxID=2737049 RepID=UPI0015C4997B|nr:glycosyltransferase family 4 protein [Bacillus sp. EB106-08-02-XG196]NWQ41098.1 glycosyltransferase family 4 protein [Bacillus sp. EB106-08-02-XG196]